MGHDYGIISRFPFLDHQLQEYLYQLPENTDFGRLYRKMLIKYFPEYFVNIDNLNTGNRLFVNDKLNYISKVFTHLKSQMGLEKYSKKYTDYTNWLKNYDGGLIDKYILSENLKLYDYVDYQEIKEAVNSFLNTGKKSILVSRIITLNIFLEDYKK